LAGNLSRFVSFANILALQMAEVLGVRKADRLAAVRNRARGIRPHSALAESRPLERLSPALLRLLRARVHRAPGIFPSPGGDGLPIPL
jgi:hypothetical protein